MSKKVISIIVCVVSIIAIIIYTVLQLVGEWRGNISIYVIGIIALIFSLSEIINQKKTSNIMHLIGFILIVLIFIFVIGGCIFLYLFNQS